MSKIDWSKLDTVVCVEKAEENYLFNSQLQKIDRLADEFIASSNKVESIIGILGDRGSGKSSLLKTVEKKLANRYYSLGVLDPGAFDQSMTIIELFVNSIFQYVNNNALEEQVWSFRDKLIGLLKKATKILSDYKVGAESFYRDYDYSEILQNLETRINMSGLIKDIVRNFLSYVNFAQKKNYTKLALYIDDVDIVSNSKVYSLLEDIRKYLAGNILVVIAYRNEQLFESVLQEKINENKTLIDNHILSVEQMKEQVSRYLEKLIPVHNRVSVLNTENLLDIQMGQLVHDLKCECDSNDDISAFIDERMPVKQWIKEKFENRLRLKMTAIDDSENTVYNLPTNLRGILQLVRLILTELSELDFNLEGSGGARLKFTENLLHNIETYKGYFINNLKYSLPTKLLNKVLIWLGRETKAKNYFTCSAVFDLISEIKKNGNKFEDEYELVLNLTKYQIYNITLGDVHRVLDIYKHFDLSVEGRYFVYAVKVLYSFELLSHYLSAVKCALNHEDYSEWINNYLTLINAQIIFEGFTYIQGDSKALAVKYIKNKNIEDIYKYLFFTDISLDGDIRRAKTGQRSNISAFNYRPIVNYELNFDSTILTVNIKYPIAPYAFVGQKWYVENTIYEFINSNTTGLYVFYSMFDIDIFVRLNYGKPASSPHVILNRILSKISSLLSRRSGALHYYENDISCKISNCIYSVECKGYNSVYNGELISEVDKLDFASYVTDDDIKELKKYQAVDLLDRIKAKYDVGTSDREKATGYLDILATPRKQVSSEMKSFIKNMCNKYNIDLNTDSDDE